MDCGESKEPARLAGPVPAQRCGMGENPELSPGAAGALPGAARGPFAAVRRWGDSEGAIVMGRQAGGVDGV